jgi:hypothetical protein
VDVPGVDVTLPHVELPLSQLVPGAQGLNVEVPQLRHPSNLLADR